MCPSPQTTPRVESCPMRFACGAPPLHRPIGCRTRMPSVSLARSLIWYFNGDLEASPSPAAAEEPQDQKQQNSADRCRNNRRNHAAADMDSELREEPTPDQRADDA